MSRGPLGELPGMTFDPLRNRYFPTPKNPPPSPPAAHSRSGNSSRRDEIVNMFTPGPGQPFCVKKRPRSSEAGEAREEVVCGGGGRRVQRGRGRMGALGGRQRERGEESVLSKLVLDAEHHSCGCEGEVITSYQSYGDEAYAATTDHGKLILHWAGGNTVVFHVCPQPLVSMHWDVMRMSMMAISGGVDPHVHLFIRDPSLLDHIRMVHGDIKLKGDIYAVSSFDDKCTIGGTKSLTVIDYKTHLHDSDPRLISSVRKLKSDALSLDQYTSDNVLVGQRSGEVISEDLRVQPGKGQMVGSTRKRKAVVGVKKVPDSAVPWGVAVSGMGNEMLLYDARYSEKPLHIFEGHVNNFQTKVSLALSPSGEHVFSSGSDNRIRGWSTLTGEPLSPQPAHYQYNALTPFDEASEEENPLSRAFDDKISHLVVREDLGLDVVVQAQLYRFAK
ncbi:WD-repeat protein 21A [Cryptococcus wingfieldii CBS 7118]|uniref:WD-repeat protein 21A n=1 Tax=Cryptococcus wingfieldii CBS 7118 TaxID=1295528 RepID=A0A1E3IMB5_9TREE|nr:WD-repeat protein 21A [Cryptococcus wingfieldii CBS 7118]ODN89732.1 WD-repeat protein 21A [Cryptococcus wingfieldii CBS 7118]